MNAMHQMTCSEFVRRRPDLIDGEVGTAEARALNDHLDEGARCLQKFRFERRLIDEVRRRLRAVERPPALAGKVARLIEAFGTEV
jgi:hypothetical protein